MNGDEYNIYALYLPSLLAGCHISQLEMFLVLIAVKHWVLSGKARGSALYASPKFPVQSLTLAIQGTYFY